MKPKSKSSTYPIVLTVCLSLLLLSGCKEDMKALYQKAMKAYQSEDYSRAAELFEKILQKYPDHDLARKARYELGNIYFYKLKQPQKSLKYLQDLYANSQPGKYSLEALKLIGYIYDKSLNECQKSIEVYRLLIRDYASDIDAGEYQYTIAECYFKRHDYIQALTEHQALIENSPESRYVSRSLFQVANINALSEQWEEALALYQELLLVDNLHPQLLLETKLELAFCYEHVEQFENALQVYQAVETMNPENIMLDTTLLQRKIERVQEALKDSQRKPEKVDWSRNK